MAAEKRDGINHNLRATVRRYLDIPMKSGETNKKIVTGLGDWLVSNGYITGVETMAGSWGFMYENRKIYVAELPMSKENYNHYIFRLGSDPATGRPLYPAYGEETDQYRFLHEAGHAWQESIVEREGGMEYYQKAINGESLYMATLFGEAYRLREENPGKGLSTWGNVPDYNRITDPRLQRAARAWEDANELMVMYLWSPEYFKTYMDYLTGNLPGYGEADLEKDGLIKVPLLDNEPIWVGARECVNEIRFKVGMGFVY